MLYFEMVDFEDTLSKLARPPLIANDFDNVTKAGREHLSAMLCTRYEGDVLQITPTCDCGEVTGGINVGKICSICNTVCCNPVERDIESQLWLQVPNGIHKFVSPIAWSILTAKLKVPKCNVLMWLTDPLYVPEKIPNIIRRFEAAGVIRGLNNFVTNFDAIMELYFNTGKDPTVGDLEFIQFITENRKKLFTAYLPMMSKIGFVVESNDSGKYADKNMTILFDAMYSVTTMDHAIRPLSIASKESRTVSALNAMVEFYKLNASKTLARKQGLIRKQICGGRLNFTCRAVITSISEPHEYDECHLPWSMSLQLFKVHIANKLLKRGYTPIKIERLLSEYALRFHPVLNDIFIELINESPQGKIPIVLQRNPSLTRGSAQQLYVTKIRTDPSINTIGISVKILKAPNADFDGDEFNGMLILDAVMFKLMQRLAPHLGVMDLNVPWRISTNLTMPAPVISTMANWLSDDG